MLTPAACYERDLKRSDFKRDEAQEYAVKALNQVFLALSASGFKPAKSRLLKKQPPLKGLYLWGRVGRGKTYLMDCFFHCLPAGRGVRLHFHRFMQRIHRELTNLSGYPNPLRIIARQLANEAPVLCFDEFFVSDIGDAMILGNLLDELFRQGVVLITTSNIPPHDLYKDGLQRQRFLPAIKLLENHTDVIAVNGITDHRLRQLHPAHNFFQPLTSETTKALRRHVEKVTITLTSAACIKINQRPVPACFSANGLAWFEFDGICDGPRSQNDYIEIARLFHTVVISNVPALGGDIRERKIAIGTEDCDENSIATVNRTFQHGRMDDQARRFIALVDEFYDRKVKLIISAEKPITQLYAGGRVGFEFQRTVSRLLEMQSHEYMQLSHCP